MRNAAIPNGLPQPSPATQGNEEKLPNSSALLAENYGIDFIKTKFIYENLAEAELDPQFIALCRNPQVITACRDFERIKA